MARTRGVGVSIGKVKMKPITPKKWVKKTYVDKRPRRAPSQRITGP